MVCASGEPLSHAATLFCNITLVASACEIIKWTTMMRLDFVSRYFILVADNLKYFNKIHYFFKTKF